jgi:hypothetical protein
MPTTAELEAMVSDPREQMHVELKSWLDLSTNEHKAVLAKAIIALANHGGGFVVIGFVRTDGLYAEAPNRPADLGAFNDDVINGVVRSYAAPAFHCTTYLIAHPDNGLRYPIVEVPGSHRVPIQAVRGSPDRSLMNGRVYVRRPGPESAEPGTPEEWRSIFTRCLRANRDDLLDAMRDVLVGQPGTTPPQRPPLEALLEFADEATTRWARLSRETGGGVWREASYRLAYAIQGEFVHPRLPDLRRHLRTAMRPNTGRPEWAELEGPRAMQGGLESFTEKGPHRPEFWRALPDGRLALIRGYQEDNSKNLQPGTAFDVAVPIWRVGECLLHARAMCERLDAPDAPVIVTARYLGLARRRLVSLDGRYMLDPFERRSAQDTIDLSGQVRASEIEDKLPEIVHGMLQPLYYLFDLLELSQTTVIEEIARLRRRQ